MANNDLVYTIAITTMVSANIVIDFTSNINIPSLFEHIACPTAHLNRNHGFLSGTLIKHHHYNEKVSFPLFSDDTQSIFTTRGQCSAPKATHAWSAVAFK